MAEQPKTHPPPPLLFRDALTKIIQFPIDVNKERRRRRRRRRWRRRRRRKSNKEREWRRKSGRDMMAIFILPLSLSFHLSLCLLACFLLCFLLSFFLSFFLSYTPILIIVIFTVIIAIVEEYGGTGWNEILCNVSWPFTVVTLAARPQYDRQCPLRC